MTFSCFSCGSNDSCSFHINRKMNGIDFFVKFVLDSILSIKLTVVIYLSHLIKINVSIRNRYQYFCNNSNHKEEKKMSRKYISTKQR